jgi:chemotaxis protein MotA
MFAIIGFVMVLGAVMGGYLMEHGQLKVLMQPAELVIIGGAGLGTLLIANPLSTITRIVSGLISVLKGSTYDQAFYLSSLKMMSDLFMVARKQGMVKLEEDVENPSKNQIFSKYPKFLANHHATALCATRCEWRSRAAWRTSI